jgi:hypothetical protein
MQNIFILEPLYVWKWANKSYIRPIFSSKVAGIYYYIKEMINCVIEK